LLKSLARYILFRLRQWSGGVGIAQYRVLK
jgi:hypothetical protein